MYPRITIQSGISAGTSYRIDSRVARIGSDPQSDVCLPTTDIPAHALTLEFREDSCLVYNRCRNQVIIGAQIVAPDQSAVWPETDILQLAGGIELLLDFDEHPVSATVIDYEDDDEEADFDSDSDRNEVVEATHAQQGNTTKTIVQLSVTAFCVLGCVLLLVRDQNRTKPTVQLSLQQIVDTDFDSSPENKRLVKRIQFAELQRIRGRKKVAQKEFEFIRDSLVSTQSTEATSEDDFQSNVLSFVQSRLAK